MAASPLAFGELLAGAILLDKGVQAVKGALDSSGTGSSSAGTGSPGVSPTGGTPPSASGGHYSIAQIEQLWVTEGGNPAQAATAAAVAMAESSGNANASNSNSNGSTDRGLWQINSVHGTQSTYDPVANAQAAIAISNNGSDWSAWVTYTTGAYHQFLASAEQVASQLGLGHLGG
jgi:hypothetical protein